MEEGIR